MVFDFDRSFRYCICLGFNGRKKHGKMKKNDIKSMLQQAIELRNVGKDFRKEVYALDAKRGSKRGGLIYFFDQYLKIDWKDTVAYFPYSIITGIEKNGESLEILTTKGKFEFNLTKKKKIFYL